MNDHPQFFASHETMFIIASVLLQAMLVIVLALLAGRLLKHQPVLRHSVLLAGLLCVCCCPLTSYLASRIDAPLISIQWPVASAADPEQTVPNSNRTLPPSTTQEANSLSTDDLATTNLTGTPPSRDTEQPATVPDAFQTEALESVTAATRPTSERAGASSTAFRGSKATLSANNPNTHGFGWTDVANIAGVLWLVGMIVIAIRLLLAWRYLNRLRSGAASLDEQSLPQLRDLREHVLDTVSVKRLPNLLVSDELNGPISLGLFHPAIILPREMAQRFNASEFRDVLIHETAHIHRCDHVVVLLQRLAGAVFWPFPMVWHLNTKLDEAREDVCDNYVLRHTEASQYCRMLLELTERLSLPQAIPLAIGLWKCRRSLEQRVTALLDPRRTTTTRLPRRTMGTLTVAFALIAILLASSRIIPAGEVQAAESQQLLDEESNSPANLLERKDEDASNALREEATAAADNQAQTDPYDTLYDVIMTRWKDGKAYAQDETSPAVFTFSEFPFDNQTFDKFNSALDAFAAIPQTKIEQYSDIQRALMQRNLWDIFEYTFNWDWPEDWWWEGQRSYPKTHMQRRYVAQPKIAALIKRLALSKEQILALPSTLAATIESGEFAPAYDPGDPFKPFLPRDLYSSTESSWICVGEDGEEIPADLHTGRVYNRSMFLQFMRLPGGRAETLEYMDRISKRPHQFPVGTQFALLERPFLISEDGELVLSPLVVAVQLRAYLDVGRDFRRYDDEPKATQCVAEFVMQPRELMKGNAVMRAMGPKDFHFDAGADAPTPGFSAKDPFMTGKLSGGMPLTRLNQCMDCHSRAGGRGVRTRSFKRTGAFFIEGNPETVAKATAAQKLEHDEYKTLQKYWRGERVELPKPDAQPKEKSDPTMKKEPNPDRFPDTPELRAALMSRVEAEIAAELKSLHSAVLLAEVAKLTDMFNLEELESGRLRIAAREAANSAVEKARDSIRASFTNNVINTLNEKILVDGSRSDPDLTAFRFNDRYIVLDAGGQDPDDRNRWDSLGFKLSRRVLQDWLRVGFRFGTSGMTVSPKDSDVQDEEAWKTAISAVLTAEQVKEYTEHKANRLKTTVVDLMLTTLQFDLDLKDSQLPVIRRRIEERVTIRPSMYDDIERTVGPALQRLKADGLGDILSKEQLEAFPEHPKSRIKSTIISLILTELQFDLHLADSHLPVVRKRLEDRINIDGLSSSVESKAMRIRWNLKEKDVADVLSEPELTLWRFTQEQHN